MLVSFVNAGLMTFCLQSSAAATSITMLLLASGAITFPNAVAFILGENIGTTITSNLAATSTNVSSKRTARAHLVFNLFGSILVIALFRPYMMLNAQIVEWLGFPNPLTADFSILSQTGLEGEAISRLREEHLKNMEVKSYDYTAGVYYFDLIQELETMGDFMINISQALVGLN